MNSASETPKQDHGSEMSFPMVVLGYFEYFAVTVRDELMFRNTNVVAHMCRRYASRRRIKCVQRRCVVAILHEKESNVWPW